MFSSRLCRALIACIFALPSGLPGQFFQPQPSYLQQGGKWLGTKDSGFGGAVAISADGNTVAVTAPVDTTARGKTGAVFVYNRSQGVWSRTARLVGTDGNLGIGEGQCVAISADGNTIVASTFDVGQVAWVFTRVNGSWTQVDPQPLGGPASLPSPGEYAGYSVAISADSNTVIVGAPGLSRELTGGAWVFRRNNGVWSLDGGKLVGSGGIGQICQGRSVALSADGNTAVLGGNCDNSFVGAMWVFSRAGGVWRQSGSKLVGAVTPGCCTSQGESVALSSDGKTALSSGYSCPSTGAVFPFVETNGIWAPQGPRFGRHGWAVALSPDGNTALVGSTGDDGNKGAAYVYTHTATGWAAQGGRLVGSDIVNVALTGGAEMGRSVALSADAKTAVVSASYDNSYTGAVWVFVKPTVSVALTSSLNPAGYGAAVTLTATVTPEVSGLLTPPSAPIGNIEFFDGPVSLGTALLNGGRASLTIPRLEGGTHTLTASYPGDSLWVRVSRP